jgi:hypothetical protein
VEKETNQLSLILWLRMEYGMAKSYFSLHLSLSRQNLGVPSKYYVCQQFVFWTRVEIKTNQLFIILWLCTHSYLPQILLSPHKRRVSTIFCICCRNMCGNRDKSTILNTLNTVWVWNGNILYLSALIPISLKFFCPSMKKGVNDYVVGTCAEEETKQVSLIVWLRL